ncbi:zinc finger SWIM domain-containing protein 7 isoform X2 [Protopterus annectens]|uniref:zinc finger SWIM domain-containing protein 7 isoform X2 n=2 Tax=Protopterus annectens TaxID=7888 RepID=UPI001CFBF5A6|nr:zinc finger SWIM domain-containing protein 7 isoform X2 [Protopterus annectens]
MVKMFHDGFCWSVFMSTDMFISLPYNIILRKQVLEMDAVLPSAAEELLREIQKQYLETKQIPDDLLLALKFMFGPIAVHALDLVDQHSVTQFVAPSGRAVYQVIGSSGRVYSCFSSCHYCSCPAFSFSVLRKNDSLLCKHILAVYLSQATGTCQEVTTSAGHVTGLLLAKEEDNT